MKVIKAEGNFELVSWTKNDRAHYAIRETGSDELLEVWEPTDSLKGWDLRKHVIAELDRYDREGPLKEVHRGDYLIEDYINKVYCMDNLELMKQLPDNSIDLIYGDILYGTGRNFKDYQDIKANKATVYSFYIPRIQEMHRIVKDNGVIILQMDYRIVHWIRSILDDVFGYDNFINEIIWHYKKFSQNNDRTFLTNHDNILVYGKGKDYTFNTQYIVNKDKEKRIKKGYFNCGGGRYLVYDWDKFKEFTKNRNIPKENIVDKTDDTPYTRCDDVFRDINFINSQSKERVGYETQKPKKLLYRIINAFSNEGDIVADFFCGSGTTGVVAKELGRNYIICDISPKAVEISERRISEVQTKTKLVREGKDNERKPV